MRIAQVATAATPVRRHNSGSVEALVWHLTRELVRLGHEVTVFGTAGSDTTGRFVETLPGPYATDGSPEEWLLCEWLSLTTAAARAQEFDVLHSHAYLLGVPLQPLVRTPIVHTMHLMPGPDQASLAAAARPGLVTALSRHQWLRYPAVAPQVVVHHGVDEDEFAFREQPDDYAFYLGRFSPDKGPVEAVRAAEQAGLRLVLAGPENDYFRDVVRPLVDGESVEYVGSVTGQQRVELLQGARALLYPLRSGEPFGLVLIEAMMCGTPVACLDRGAVREVVDEGLTGCVAPGADALAAALLDAVELDRSAVRRQAETRFTTSRMARQYVEAYDLVVQGEVP